MQDPHPPPVRRIEVGAVEGGQPRRPLRAAEGVAPEVGRGDGDLGGVVRLPRLEAGPERLAGVVEPASLGGGEAGREPAVHPAGRGRHGREMLSVPLPGGRRLTRLLEAIGTEEADGLEEAVAAGLGLAHDEALVDQFGQRVGHGLAVRRGGEGLDGVEVEPRREDREVAQERLFSGLQQLVAPADRRRHGLVPGVGPARAAGQGAEAALEPAGQLGEVPPTELSGGQLEGQREAVETPTEGDDIGVLRIPTHPRLRLPRPFDEELGGTFGQRLEREDLLLVHPQGLPARRQHPELRTGAHEALGQVGRGIEQVLAVVEDHQQLAPPRCWASWSTERDASPSIPAASARTRVTSSSDRAGIKSAQTPPTPARSHQDRAAARAMVVLPTPPGPTTPTSRPSSSRSSRAVSSASRPIRRVRGSGSWPPGPPGLEPAASPPSPDAPLTTTSATKR